MISKTLRAVLVLGILLMLPLSSYTESCIYNRLVYIKSFFGTYLRADKEKGQVSLSDQKTEDAQWLIIPHEAGACFRSVWGTYLQALNPGPKKEEWYITKNVDQSIIRNTWTFWDIEIKGDSYGFFSYYGSYLSGNPNKYPAQSPHCLDWEKWTIVLN